MYQVFKQDKQLVATFAHEEDAVAWCKYARGTMFILEPGLSPVGFVVDTLWLDSEPGTSCVFPTREAAALFAAEPLDGRLVANIRELSLESLSAVRRSPSGEWVEQANSLRMFA